jgi:hypothetical protein
MSLAAQTLPLIAAHAELTPLMRVSRRLRCDRAVKITLGSV